MRLVDDVVLLPPGHPWPWGQQILEAFMLEIPASQSQTWQDAQTQAPQASGSAQTLTTIICPICDAVYAPALAQVPFLQTSPQMLESAFMSMCHFCFRCRRPACPQCWDHVHGVCGSCVRETQLSFRAQAAPLDGLLFQPVQWQEHHQQEVAAALLVCVKSGRFMQTDEQVQTASVEPARTSEDHIPAHLPALHTETETENAQRNIAPTPATTEISRRMTEKMAAAQIKEAGEEKARDEDEDEGLELRPHAAVRVLRAIERVLTIIALVLLLAILALVIVAQVSETANTLIFHVLHIDIRAEVAYLVHLIQQLRQ
jgi:hypothetical protein